MSLEENLNNLRLYYLAGNLEQFILNAKSSKWSLKKSLERLTDLELIEKTNRSTRGRLKAAKIGRTKLMSEFDWAWPKEIERPVIENILIGDFIKEGQNIVLAGSQGVGKSMIAKNIGLRAITNGHRVLFTSAANMVLDLSSQESSVALQRRLKKYTSPELLIIDELGYLSFDNRSADLIFEIINQRYEIGSVVITTNLAFKDWGSVFQGSACVTALIDRLTHHCQVVKIVADSYRTMEANKTKQRKMK